MWAFGIASAITLPEFLARRELFARLRVDFAEPDGIARIALHVALSVFEIKRRVDALLLQSHGFAPWATVGSSNRRRGMLPETLHNCARSSRHLCPKYSVNSTRFLGHKCSCPWGYVFLFFMLFEGNIVFLGRNIVLFEENIAFFVEISYVF